MVKEIMTIRLGPELRASLDDLARANECSRGEIVRRFLAGKMGDAAFRALSPRDKIAVALAEMDAERTKAEEAKGDAGTQ